MDYGSSPPVRGKREHGGRDGRHERIIPACAGQTFQRPRKVICVTDHPRLCGANVTVRAFVSDAAGSSPPVRGKPCIAYLSTPRSTDHPRLCGANYPLAELMKHSVGSSPPVRGKRTRLHVQPILARIIPACAGQTSSRPLARSEYPDHPRLCGANFLATSPNPAGPLLPHTSRQVFTFAPAGSSPPVRGKPLLFEFPLRVLRIIPACAGQTNVFLTRLALSPDHPRLCGANL